MKAMMRKAAHAAARRVGLAPRSRVDELADSVQRGQTKIAELKKALEEARAEIRRWKTKAEEAARTAAASAKDESGKLAKRYEKVEEELARIREREEKHRARIADLHERAETAQRALRIAREQLMAIEVKLDMVEGALTVLDGRTRAALAASDRQTPETPSVEAAARR